MTFGGCHDDLMLVVSHQPETGSVQSKTERLLFEMSKPKVRTLPTVVLLNHLTLTNTERSAILYIDTSEVETIYMCLFSGIYRE